MVTLTLRLQLWVTGWVAIPSFKEEKVQRADLGAKTMSSSGHGEWEGL